MNISFSFLLLLVAFYYASTAFGATLPEDEVLALKDIAKTLGKTDWDFSVHPCSEQRVWRPDVDIEGSDNAVICSSNCSSANIDDDTECQTLQSLPGTLPPELTRLPYLQEMVLESNQLSGNLPLELGNLTQIQRLYLTSNNFTGELPVTLAKLTTLQKFRIGDNQFSGKIPDFIQNCTSLTKLFIQGSGLSGPIPSGISLLENLIDLRITDLNGYEYSPFPQLNNMTFKHLILRSCNINGTLPAYLGTMNVTNLKTLDLSFNKLSGPIPRAYDSLINVHRIYLTGNLLTGSVPTWTEKADNVDLSYNNFSIGNQESPTCQERNVNLFASSLTHNDSGTVSCLRGNFDCAKSKFLHPYSLHINCGGKLVIVNDSTYDDDSDAAGPARFQQKRGRNWAFSTTGNFMNNDKDGDYYTWDKKPTLSMVNAELYMNARVSPISLTYYGFCLGNGNYTVNLYFAEIMFSNDQTYNSLGRRVFDIYIQGKLVKKDFNIAKEAGGVAKAVTMPFTAVVTNKTLEIRLYWAGKGTTVIPFSSVYGPLISAISVRSDFSPPRENGSGMSAEVVFGVVAAVVAVIILVFGILWWKGCLGKKKSLARELKGLNQQTSLFTLRQIKAATNNFDIGNKIGEGGFGPVYKGCLSDGTLIAVKQLSSKSSQGNREFLTEIGMISALQNPHLVKLCGCCVEGDQLLLIYEYLENNSLARSLFGPEEHQIKLDWPTRYKICVGIARGLAYLHEESRLKVVHRDIKATNVLLDKDLNPKISDFGMAKLNEEDNTHISTRIAGTYGYMAPEYAMHGYLTDKADVYSFGIVALEIIYGRNNTTYRQTQEAFYLLDWARLLKEKGNLMELVDKRLGSGFNKEEVMVMINVALLCTNASPTLRPTMSSVVSMLEGRTVVQEVVLDTSEVLDEKKLEAMRQYYHDQNILLERPYTASSSSATDFYSAQVDSSYWEKRD
ncbi:probable leucine-rich repeat receptor-like serine/threonine-protein kinase At3g14840 [Lotus japonicus]|uniref:probable leucine-rich repeat receptor-like serine/threonine-protein kinase At3g14840 n=1 Tax=Lotus japonicus TaxID=34305 RepID=UPI0025910CE2|nr:probable leucine-rich repeat receptor-like serine/threonine-protein kinase At3g14840 [Lotus japonicus]